MEAYVLGIGIVGGFGAGIRTFSKTLADRSTRIQTVTVKTSEGLRDMPAFLADTSGLEGFVQKKALRRMDHYSKMALLGAYLALEDAGELDSDRGRLGIVVASGYGASRSTYAFLDSFLEGNDAFSSPTHFSNSVRNAAAANISITLGITGPCLTVSQFEMSVPSALITAVEWLNEERVDKVLFGSVDEYCDLLGYCWHRFYGHNHASSMNPLMFDTETAVVGEGAAFFLISLEGGTETTYGKIVEVRTQCTNGFDHPDPNQTFYILGADGHKGWGRHYKRCLTENMRIVSYTPLYGSFPTNMAFDMAAAFSVLRAKRLFALPKGCSYSSELNIIKEERALGAEKISCLKFADNGESGTILIAKD